MLHWQKEHVRDNLISLIEFTNLNALLKACLLSEGVLHAADIGKLEAIQQTKGVLEGSAELWGILPSRHNGYEKITKALNKCRQSGAAKILEEGIWTRGILYTKVMNHGKLTELQEILNINNNLRKDLADIISMSEEGIKCFVTGDNILELVRNTIPHSRSYYIERLISNNIKVNPKVFTKDCKDVFVFKKIERSKLTELAHPNSTSVSSNQLLRITSRFVLLENDIDWEDMLKICKQPMHLITFEDDSYILEETTGDSNIIRDYFAPENLGENVFISEDELLEKIQKIGYSSNVCICDSPGMGKSLLLASLATKTLQKYPERVVALIPLSNFTTFQLGDAKLANYDSALSQVLNYLTASDLGRMILEKAVGEDIIKFELFFDGFDEIPAHLLNPACSFFKHLTQFSKQLRVYIASRPQHQTELEKMLRVISYKIRPFSTENQIDFLASFWKLKFPRNDIEKFRTFASECVSQMKQNIPSEERDILGIPLQCYLLGEVYLNEARLFSEPLRKNIELSILKSIDTVFDMYEKFIQSKIPSQYESDGEEILQYHVSKALQLICPEIAELHTFSNNHYLDRSLSAGILEATKSTDGTVHNFVHRTFAEYFVGKFCADILTGSKSYNNLKCTNHYEMLDLMLARFLDTREVSDLRLKGTDVFNFHYPVVSFFLNAQLTTLKDIKVVPCIVERFQGYFTQQKVYRFLRSCLHVNCLHLIRLMVSALENFAPNLVEAYKKYFRKRSVRLWNSIVYTSPLCCLLSEASKFLNLKNILEIFNVVCNYVEVSLAEICRKMPIDLDDPMTEGCKNADYDMVEYFLDKISLENKRLISLNVCDSHEDKIEVLNKKIEMCKLLLKANPALLFEDDHDDDDDRKEPFYSNVHLKIIKFLYSRGATLCHTSHYGDKTPIIENARAYMSSADYHELVQYLIRAKNSSHKVSVVQDDFYSPLNTIIGYRCNVPKLKACTLKLLLDIPEIGLDQYDLETGNVLHLAVKENQYKENLEELIRRGVNLHGKTHKGRGVLHLAAITGSLSTIKFFMSKKLPSNDRDKFGNTPLFLAKNNKVAKYFINQGSDLYDTNIDGNTVGHMFVLSMKSESFIHFFEYITKQWDAPKLFNKKNYAGRTPLHEYIDKRIRKTSSVKLNFLLRIPANDLNGTDEEGNSLILSAIQNDWDHLLLQKLVKHGYNFQLENKKGQSALQLAVSKNNLNTVSYLLSLRMPLNTVHPSCHSPLILECNSLDMIKHLIKKGAKIPVDGSFHEVVYSLAKNASSSEGFHDFVMFISDQCVRASNFDIRGFKALLQDRLLNNLTTNDGTLQFFIDNIKNYEMNIEQYINKLFQLAVIKDSTTVSNLRILVQYGADCTNVNKNCPGILQEIIEKGNPDVVEYLFSLGLSPNEPYEHEQIARLFLDYDGFYCKSNYIQLIKCLIQYGVDMSLTDDTGSNIVHNAASTLDDVDFYELTNFFLETEETVGLIYAKNSAGETPIHTYIKRAFITNTDLIKPILRRPKININEEDNEGFNYFLAAVKPHQSLTVLKKLVKWGCNPNAVNLVGDTALHISAKGRYWQKIQENNAKRVETVTYLVSLGIDPNQLNKSGKSAINIMTETLVPDDYESEQLGQQDFEDYLVTQKRIKDILEKGKNEHK